MADNKSDVKRAKEIINKIFGNTSVSQQDTKEDLKEIRDEIDELLSSM